MWLKREGDRPERELPFRRWTKRQAKRVVGAFENLPLPRDESVERVRERARGGWKSRAEKRSDAGLNFAADDGGEHGVGVLRRFYRFRANMGDEIDAISRRTKVHPEFGGESDLLGFRHLLEKKGNQILLPALAKNHAI